MDRKNDGLRLMDGVGYKKIIIAWWDLTRHLTARADDNHAAPSFVPRREILFPESSLTFKHNTTTIGIRRSPAERTVLELRKTTVDTKFGPVEVKLCTHKGNTYCYPEYESVKAVCQETGQNYRCLLYTSRCV